MNASGICFDPAPYQRDGALPIGTNGVSARINLLRTVLVCPWCAMCNVNKSFSFSFSSLRFSIRKITSRSPEPHHRRHVDDYLFGVQSNYETTVCVSVCVCVYAFVRAFQALTFRRPGGKRSDLPKKKERSRQSYNLMPRLGTIHTPSRSNLITLFCTYYLMPFATPRNGMVIHHFSSPKRWWWKSTFSQPLAGAWWLTWRWLQ